MKMSIEGIQEVMARNNRRINDLRPEGAAGEAVRDAVIALHRYAVQITHVDTGSLRASHRMDVNELEGMVYIDSGSVNPRTREKPSIYGVIENARGGEHAFYDRTVSEIGEQVRARATKHITESVIYAK